MKSPDNIYQPLIFSLVALVGMVIGMRLQESLPVDFLVSKIEPSPEIAIEEALRHIEEKYYGEADYVKMTDEVLKKMLDRLDPYSSYFKNEMDARFNHFINGTYEGLGFEFFEYQDTFFVTRVIKSSPAFEGGLQTGDVLLAVDSIGISRPFFNRDSLYNLSKRHSGDSIQLTTFRKSTGKYGDLVLVVDEVKSSLVTSFRIEHSNILYLEIERFSNGTFTAVMDEIDQYKRQGIEIEHLIIDLRDNPGGLLNEAIKLLNQLITEADLMLTSTINKDRRVTEFKSNGRGFLDLDRIVVIINGNSASASEILAGALQDHDRSLIVGDTSYGKGVIQQNYDLSNGGSINITVGEYILPTGRKISKKINSPADTVDYRSFRLNRKLVEHSAIIPDVRIWESDCLQSLKSSLGSALKTALIKSRVIYSLPEIHVNDAKVEEKLWPLIESSVSINSECKEVVKEHIRWLLWHQIRQQSDELPVNYADSEIKKSVFFIQQTDFDSILVGGL